MRARQVFTACLEKRGAQSQIDNEMKVDSESSSLLRQRSSMIVFALEQALGEYVKRCHSGSPEIDTDATVSACLTRGMIDVAASRRAKLSHAVAESYFDELLRIAVSLASSTEDEKHVSSLAELVRSISLFEVRNAVAHPNREFPENFWYRCAVVATSIPITMLGLDGVIQAFQAALDNRITLPPEEWLNLTSFVIPNNLPRETEHDATGLIGRQKERKQLISLVKARRSPVIVITGPGGLGKTALATQVLREYSQDYSSEPAHDAIVFASLKEEALTSDGISRLQVSQSIEDLKYELAEDLGGFYPEAEAQTFEAMCADLADRKILLFVDNLEILLRDAPDSFGAFCDGLPREWSVLATSRVTVDGARSIPLETLSESDAISLAFRYADTRQVELNRSAIDRIVKSSQRNPLALRLGIDLIAEGRPIDDATRKAASDVVGFSFQNLVSALSKEGLSILECLFVKSPMGRGEIVSLLNLSSEQVVENARKLARTSLVRREVKGEDEEFDLNPSVRDLLRDSPAALGARREIQKALQEQRRNLNRHLSILRGRGINENSEEFLPESTPPALGNALARCIRYYKGTQYSYKQTNGLAKELAEFTYTYGNDWRIWLWLGRLHSLLQDDKTAENHFNTAVERSSGSPVPLLVLSETLMRSHRYDEACECTDTLLQQGVATWDKPDDIFVPRVWYNRLRCLVELSRYDEVLELKSSQPKSERLRVCILMFQCESLVRKVSHFHSDRDSQAGDTLSKAMSKIEDCLSSGHYQKSLGRLIPFVIRESKHFIESCQSSEDSAALQRILKKVGVFIYSVLESGVLEEGSQDDLISFVSWSRAHKNPELNASFSDPKWNIYLGLDSASASIIDEARSSGFEIATVTRIPNSGGRDGLSAFCFARLDSGEQIFIHRDNVQQMEYIKWVRLRPGTPIGVASLVESRSNKLRVAEKVILM